MNSALRLSGFLLIWTVILFTAAVSVYGMAGDGNLLAQEMLRHAPPGKTGLPEAEYKAVGCMTAAYLTGREDTFGYTFADAEGRVYQCFQAHEAEHMADCRELIRLAGRLRWIFGGAALILAGAGVLLRNKKTYGKGMLTSLAAAGVFFSIVVLWAAIDFDGFFTAFHRIAFTNGGWLLDYRTDLLIRLMPVPFFVSLGARLLLRILAAAAAAGTAAWIISRQGRKARV